MQQKTCNYILFNKTRRWHKTCDHLFVHQITKTWNEYKTCNHLFVHQITKTWNEHNTKLVTIFLSMKFQGDIKLVTIFLFAKLQNVKWMRQKTSNHLFVHQITKTWNEHNTKLVTIFLSMKFQGDIKLVQSFCLPNYKTGNECNIYNLNRTQNLYHLFVHENSKVT